jgi:hypothetical protein
MGMEEATGAGLDVDDISSILKGHVPDRYRVRGTTYIPYIHAYMHTCIHAYMHIL